MTTNIVDQFGRPYYAAPRPHRRTISSAPVADSMRSYVADGITPQRMAGLFKNADAGDMARQAELFDLVLERDGHLLGEYTKRVNGVLNLDFTLTPASDDPRDAQVAEFVEDYLYGADGKEPVLQALQQGVSHGCAALEVNWDTSAGQSVPKDFDFIPQKRLLFRDDKGILSRVPRLITDDASMGVDIDAWKVILHTNAGLSGHPTRSGVLRPCCWMFLFKHYDIKDWATFCEVYAMPLRVGKYDAGASEQDKEALLRAVMQLASDSAGIISNATTIEFIEASASGSGHQTYPQAIDFFNKEISKALLGQTLSAEVDGGSFAAAKTHNDIRLDLLEGDGRALAATIKHQLIRPLVGFNFGWDTPLPEYTAALEAADDLTADATWLTNLMDRGLKVPTTYLYNKFNIPEPVDNEDTIGGQAAMGQQGFGSPGGYNPWAAKAKFSAKKTVIEPETYTDALTNQLSKDAAPAVDKWLAKVEHDIFEGAESLSDVADKLLTLYPGMQPDDMATSLRQALIAAELEGRASVAK